MDIFLTAIIIAFGIFLFIKEYFSIDTSSLLIMAIFIVSGVLSPEEGFAGFIHPATLTLGCMFVISAAVFNSGLLDSVSRYIVKIAKIHYIAALVVFCLTTALFSAFINDAAVVALMIPLALLVCKETGIRPSKLLIPISFAACFGGACTLIGTGTNILISSYAEKSGLPGFGMFEFTSAAMVLALIGFLYLFLIAPFLLPKKKESEEEKTLVQEAEGYMTEVVLGNDCIDVNKRIDQTRLIKEYKAKIILIVRNNQAIHNISSEIVLNVGDRIKILISPENLLNLQNRKGYILDGNQSDKMSTGLVDEAFSRNIYEVLIPVGSELAGKPVNETGTAGKAYSILAVRHRNETIMQNLSSIKLEEGDMLLLYSSEKEVEALAAARMLYILSHHKIRRLEYKKAIPALIIAIGVVASAALNLTSILLSAMIGCLLLVTSSILKPSEAYQAIDWKVIFMLAGVLSMGMALEKTGGSELISNGILNTIGNLDHRITLSLVFLVTFLSTNILSSRASAALMAPIVISLASALQVSERPFLVAVMFACAFTFMTPVCNPTNTMVYSPGNYTYSDYLKVGTPLNIIIWIAASFIIPLFFPF